MKLTIDRNKWLRGEGFNSALYRSSDEKMCCLGFFALSCGYCKEEIIDKKELKDLEYCNENLPASLAQMTKEFGIMQTPFAFNLMHVNDTTNLSEEQREEKIKKYFAQIGIEVEFV